MPKIQQPIIANQKKSKFLELQSTDNNARGGDARLLILPEAGIRGNTHAPFADLNNLEIAKILEGFLHEKGLDGRENPHQGPQPKGLTEYTIPLAQ